MKNNKNHCNYVVIVLESMLSAEQQHSPKTSNAKFCCNLVSVLRDVIL